MGSCISTKQNRNFRNSLPALPIINTYKNKRHRRVLLIGLDNGGKTTILNLLVKGRKGNLPILHPTEGFNVENIQLNNLDLTIWDVGGQDKLRLNHWRHYYTGVQGLVLVIDSVDIERLPIVASELLLMVKDEQLNLACFMILVNKQDSSHAHSKEEIEIALGLDLVRKILKDRPIQVFATSAVTNMGIEESFNWLCKNMKNIY